MNPTPEIPATTPTTLDLEAGTYYWCTCGRSSNQPFCNGSHAGSGFVPMRFEIKEKKRVTLCNCKHTATKPYCDGSHARL